MKNKKDLLKTLLLSATVLFCSQSLAHKKVVVIPLDSSSNSNSQSACAPGQIAATAQIDVRQVSTSFTSNGVSLAYTCNGEAIFAQKLSNRLRVVIDDGDASQAIGVTFASFGVITPGDDQIYSSSSSLLSCGSIPTIRCFSFSFFDQDGQKFPDNIVHFVAYTR